MPNWVIDRVYYMAERQKQPWMARGKPVYSIIKHGNELDNNHKLIDDKGADNVDSTVSNSDEEVIDHMENEITNSIDVHDQVDEVHEEEVHDNEVVDTIEEITLEEWVRQPRRSRRTRNEEPLEAFVDADVENEGVPPKDMPLYTMLYMVTKKEEGYIFEEYKPKIISKRLTKELSKLHDNNNPKELFHYITGYLLNQMSTKVGIKKLDSKAEEALHREFLQLHKTNTFTPIFRKSYLLNKLRRPSISYLS